MNIETWHINKDVKDEDNRNKFWHQLQSRVDAWKRDIFPLDIINNLITDRKKKSVWKSQIYERIDVMASDGKYYSLIKDVDTVEFRRESETEPYQVYMHLKNGEEYQVFTPTANGNSRSMKVYTPKEVSIDHVIPLNYIVSRILENDSDISRELTKVIEARRKYRGVMTAKEIAEKIQDDVDVSLLLNAKEKVLKDTMCVLMEQGENSKKSDITPFKRYDDKEDGKYEFIVAEHVINPIDQKPYTIYYTLENKVYSEIQMKEE
jgi:hypothetical protein